MCDGWWPVHRVGPYSSSLTCSTRGKPCCPQVLRGPCGQLPASAGMGLPHAKSMQLMEGLSSSSTEGLGGGPSVGQGTLQAQLTPSASAPPRLKGLPPSGFVLQLWPYSPLLGLARRRRGHRLGRGQLGCKADVMVWGINPACLPQVGVAGLLSVILRNWEAIPSESPFSGLGEGVQVPLPCPPAVPRAGQL